LDYFWEPSQFAITRLVTRISKKNSVLIISVDIVFHGFYFGCDFSPLWSRGDQNRLTPLLLAILSA